MPTKTIERVDYFYYDVSYHHTDTPYRGYESGSSGGETSHETAQAEMLKTIQYYENLGDIQITKAIIERACIHCNGYGKISKHTGKTTRSRQITVKCPMCKGKDSQMLVETWINLPKSLFK